MAGGYSFNQAAQTPDGDSIVASLNRKAFARHGVLSVNMVGGPGAGKTTLIMQTIARLLPDLHSGVIAANSTVNPDIGRFNALAHQVAKLQSDSNAMMTASDVQLGLSQMDLADLGIVFIENISLLSGPSEYDLGEEKHVAVFSMAGGAHNAAKYPQVVQWADAIVLNKLDLAPLMAFDLESFRADVKRVNPHAKLFELSSASGQGLDQWVDWVRAQAQNRHSAAAARAGSKSARPGN